MTRDIRTIIGFMRSFAAALAVLCVLPSLLADARDDARVREAVQRSLAFLEKGDRDGGIGSPPFGEDDRSSRSIHPRRTA